MLSIMHFLVCIQSRKMVKYVYIKQSNGDDFFFLIKIVVIVLKRY